MAFQGNTPVYPWQDLSRAQSPTALYYQFQPAFDLSWVPTSVSTQPSNLSFTVDTYGKTIPFSMGNIRLAGTLIWGLPPVGGKSSFAVSFGYRLDSARTAPTVNRLWANGNLIYDGPAGTSLAGLVTQFYPGSETQGIDPTIQADRGASTPAYRGQMYLVFNQLDLSPFNGQIPLISAELLDNPGARIYVRDVILAVAAQSGYASGDVFVSNIPEFPDQCDGCILTADVTFQDFVTTLAGPYNLSIINGDQIRIIRRPTTTIDHTFTDDELVTLSPDDDVIKFDLQEVTEVPYQVEVQYINAATDYQTNSQYARQPLFPVSSTTSRSVQSISMPLVITSSEALNLAYSVVYRSKQRQSSFSFMARPKRLNIETGDIISVSNEGSSYVGRVVTSSLTPDYMNQIVCDFLYANADFNYVAFDPTRALPTGSDVSNPSQSFAPMTGNDHGGSDGGAVQFWTD